MKKAIQNYIWINGLSVHTGGAKSLIIEILNSIKDNSKYRLIIDKRLKLNKNSDKKIVYQISQNICSRLFAEVLLFLNVKKNDTVLCFGNLPPILKSKGFVINYFQSLYLLNRRELNGFPLKIKLRIFFERLWLRLFYKNVDLYIVQNSSVKDEIKTIIKNKKVLVYPFIKKNKLSFNHISESRKGFIYVSAGYPHKNHKNLIRAWILLSKKEIYPELKLTLDKIKEAELINWIYNEVSKYKLKIINLSNLDQKNLHKYYQTSEALIFPSKFETFGLPLFEAMEYHLPILASEKDYVRNIVKPVETFDPDSPLSIARAVERYIRGDNDRIRIYSGCEFVEQLECQFKQFL